MRTPVKSNFKFLFEANGRYSGRSLDAYFYWCPCAQGLIIISKFKNVFEAAEHYHILNKRPLSVHCSVHCENLSVHCGRYSGRLGFHSKRCQRLCKVHRILVVCSKAPGNVSVFIILFGT